MSESYLSAQNVSRMSSNTHSQRAQKPTQNTRHDNSGVALAILGTIIGVALVLLMASPSTQPRTNVVASNTALADSKPAQHAQVSVSKPKSAASSTPTPAPPVAIDTVSSAQEKLKALGMKPDYAALYVAVGKRFGIPWQILAGIHWQETRQRGNTIDTSTTGAIGPMQFEPPTFVGGTPPPMNSDWCVPVKDIGPHGYGVDGDGDGRACMTDINDAMPSAANDLAQNEVSRHSLWAAVEAYNGTGIQALIYVDDVWARAKDLGMQ